MQLDLHGVKHEDVVAKLDIFIWECFKTKTPTATVITGNSIAMKNIVIECLKEHGLTPNNFSYNYAIISFDLV